MPRAIVLPEPGTDLEVRDLPTPAPQSMGAPVEVRLAGVNFWAIMQRHGRVPAPERACSTARVSASSPRSAPRVTDLVVGQRVA